VGVKKSIEGLVLEHLGAAGATEGWAVPNANVSPTNATHHQTATVITTEPNELIAELPHHRMPAILAPSEWATWLDPSTPVADLQALLRPAPSNSMEVVVAGPTDFHLG
jgi:putative SOS response-associated peptidase YedK